MTTKENGKAILLIPGSSEIGLGLEKSKNQNILLSTAALMAGNNHFIFGNTDNLKLETITDSFNLGISYVQALGDHVNRVAEGLIKNNDAVTSLSHSFGGLFGSKLIADFNELSSIFFAPEMGPTIIEGQTNQNANYDPFHPIDQVFGKMPNLEEKVRSCTL